MSIQSITQRGSAFYQPSEDRTDRLRRLKADLCSYSPFAGLLIENGIDPDAICYMSAKQMNPKSDVLILSVSTDRPGTHNQKLHPLTLSPEDGLLYKAALFLLSPDETPPIFPTPGTSTRSPEGFTDSPQESEASESPQQRPQSARGQSPDQNELLQTMQELFKIFKEAQLGVAEQHTRQIHSLSEVLMNHGRCVHCAPPVMPSSGNIYQPLQGSFRNRPLGTPRPPGLATTPRPHSPSSPSHAPVHKLERRHSAPSLTTPAIPDDDDDTASSASDDSFHSINPQADDEEED